MKKLITLLSVSTFFLSILGCSPNDSETLDLEETLDSDITTTYKTISVNKVTINEMPFVDAFNSTWDVSPISGPDVKISLRDGNGNILKNSSVYNDVLNTQLPLLWSESSSLLTIDVSKFITVQLLDYDGTIDDQIGWVMFSIADYTIGSNKYPKTITETHTLSDNRKITITLDVTWK